MINSISVCFFMLAVSILSQRSPPLVDKVRSKYVNYTFGDCVGAGFKNIVLRLVERNDLIVRIGLIHEGDSVLKFRESSIGIFESALDEWIRNTPSNSFQEIILRQLLKCKVGIKDVVPRRDVEHEVLFERMSQSRSQLVFQVSGNLHRIEVPLPRSTYISADVTAVVEYNIKMAGDIRSLTPNDLTELDCLRLLLGVFADQLTFQESTGSFHLDGHPGNILYQRGRSNEIYFVWSDFGRTSSSIGSEMHFRNSMALFSNFLYNRTERYPKLRSIIVDLEHISDYYNKTYLASSNDLLRMKHLIEKKITVVYNRSFIENLLSQMSPSLHFGIQYLSERISLLEEKVQNLEAKVVELIEINARQSNEILALIALVTNQSAQIANQSAQIAKQNVHIANQSAQIANQNAQIANQSAQITDLSVRIVNLERSCGRNDL